MTTPTTFEFLTQQLYPLRQLPCLWYVAGGWAIDLFLGRVTRPHKDIDVCIARRDQFMLQETFPNCSFTYVDNAAPESGDEKPWPKSKYLQLPMHEIWMRGDGYQLEFLLNEIEDGMWISRRDSAVQLPLDEAIMESATTGVRFTSPHVALYFKAKKSRDKDTADFLACREYLNPRQLAWLFEQLGPSHPWRSLAAA